MLAGIFASLRVIRLTIAVAKFPVSLAHDANCGQVR